MHTEAMAMGIGTLVLMWMALMAMLAVMGGVADAFHRSGRLPYLLRRGRARQRANSSLLYFHDVGDS
jgi:hypothetical protein